VKIFNSDDISNIANRFFNEDLDVFAGDAENKKVILRKGFKIRHIPSGLIYSVIKVMPEEDGKGIKILCKRPGKKLLIPDSDFKDYERQ